MSIESVMPFNHLILCHPLLLLPSIFPSIRIYSNESLCIKWPKYWSFSFSISPSNEYILGQIKVAHNFCSKCFFFFLPPNSLLPSTTPIITHRQPSGLCVSSRNVTLGIWKCDCSIVVIWLPHFSKRVILLLIKRRESNLNVLPEGTQFKMYVLTGSQLSILLCKIFSLLILPWTEAQYTLFKPSVGSKVF